MSALPKPFLIGCDPEVFLVDNNGAFVSAHGLIPGNKQEPFPVTNGAIQVDGMACEFNTEPAASADEFVQYVGEVFQQLDDALPEGVTLAPGVPVATFEAAVFEAQPEEALEFGCDPDYNAYTGLANPRPCDHGEMIRTAAGHIHIGFQDTDNPTGAGHMQECCELVQLLDAYVGVYSLTFDKDVVRRKLYGSAGAFRPKEYGVEYRVLSNAWLTDPAIIRDVYDRVQAVSQAYVSGLRLPEDLADEARDIINKGQFDRVDDFLSNFNGVI